MADAKEPVRLAIEVRLDGLAEIIGGEGKGGPGEGEYCRPGREAECKSAVHVG